MRAPRTLAHRRLRSVDIPEITIDLTDVEQRLSVAFTARYGTELGPDITAEAMAWAWENREKVASMDNPAGYLFRVGQSKSRKFLRWNHERVRFPSEPATSQSTWTEPGLPAALGSLGEEERTAVVLVHCFQWTYAEVGELLDLPLHTVRNRIHRGLAQLRDQLGVEQS